MISRANSARRAIGALVVLSAALANETCSGDKDSYARCEQNQAVYRRSDDTEVRRVACASDEQCVEFGPQTALCRLLESCQGHWVSECRGDALIQCHSWEQFRERVDCTTDNHNKSVPGRCAPDTTSGADCVDSDAVKCDYSYHELCVGFERLACREGYTSRELPCSDDDRAEGGVCRMNADKQAVCAQADAEACPREDGFGDCADGKVVTCRGGFVWRHACPEGQSCIVGAQGDVVMAYCASSHG